MWIRVTVQIMEVVQSNRADRHHFNIMGQRTLKYAVGAWTAYEEEAYRQPYPCVHLVHTTLRLHHTTICPSRPLLNVRALGHSCGHVWGVSGALVMGAD